MQLPPLGAQPPQAETLSFHPVPTHLKIDSVMVQTPQGPAKNLVFMFTTPQGVNTFFLPATAAEQMCGSIRAAASDIQIVGTL